MQDLRKTLLLVKQKKARQNENSIMNLSQGGPLSPTRVHSVIFGLRQIDVEVVKCTMEFLKPHYMFTLSTAANVYSC